MCTCIYIPRRSPRELLLAFMPEKPKSQLHIPLVSLSLRKKELDFTMGCTSSKHDTGETPWDKNPPASLHGGHHKEYEQYQSRPTTSHYSSGRAAARLAGEVVVANITEKHRPTLQKTTTAVQQAMPSSGHSRRTPQHKPNEPPPTGRRGGADRDTPTWNRVALSVAGREHNYQRPTMAELKEKARDNLNNRDELVQGIQAWYGGNSQDSWSTTRTASGHGMNSRQQKYRGR